MGNGTLGTNVNEWENGTLGTNVNEWENGTLGTSMALWVPGGTIFQRIFLVVRGRPEISARKIVPPGTQSAIQVPRVPFSNSFTLVPRVPFSHSFTLVPRVPFSHSFTLVPRVPTYTTGNFDINNRPSEYMKSILYRLWVYCVVFLFTWTLQLPRNWIGCLFVLRLSIPVNNFQSCWDGATASWVLPVLSGSKVSCSRTQHGGIRFRNPDLSLRTPMPYHCITAHREIV